MAHKVKTKSPEEVKSVLNGYANLLDIYADDQLSMISRYKTPREKKEAYVRAEVYNSLAIELRETIVEFDG